MFSLRPYLVHLYHILTWKGYCNDCFSIFTLVPSCQSSVVLLVCMVFFRLQMIILALKCFLMLFQRQWHLIFCEQKYTLNLFLHVVQLLGHVVVSVEDSDQLLVLRSFHCKDYFFFKLYLMAHMLRPWW